MSKSSSEEEGEIRESDETSSEREGETRESSPTNDGRLQTSGQTTSSISNEEQRNECTNFEESNQHNQMNRTAGHYNRQGPSEPYRRRYVAKKSGQRGTKQANRGRRDNFRTANHYKNGAGNYQNQRYKQSYGNQTTYRHNNRVVKFKTFIECDNGMKNLHITNSMERCKVKKELVDEYLDEGNGEKKGGSQDGNSSDDQGRSRSRFRNRTTTVRRNRSKSPSRSRNLSRHHTDSMPNPIQNMMNCSCAQEHLFHGNEPCASSSQSTYYRPRGKICTSSCNKDKEKLSLSATVVHSPSPSPPPRNPLYQGHATGDCTRSSSSSSDQFEFSSRNQSVDYTNYGKVNEMHENHAATPNGPEILNNIKRVPAEYSLNTSNYKRRKNDPFWQYRRDQVDTKLENQSPEPENDRNSDVKRVVNDFFSQSSSTGRSYVQSNFTSGDQASYSRGCQNNDNGRPKVQNQAEPIILVPEVSEEPYVPLFERFPPLDYDLLEVLNNMIRSEESDNHTTKIARAMKYETDRETNVSPWESESSVRSVSPETQTVAQNNSTSLEGRIATRHESNSLEGETRNNSNSQEGRMDTINNLAEHIVIETGIRSLEKRVDALEGFSFAKNYANAPDGLRLIQNNLNSEDGRLSRLEYASNRSQNSNDDEHEKNTNCNRIPLQIGNYTEPLKSILKNKTIKTGTNENSSTNISRFENSATNSNDQLECNGPTNQTDQLPSIECTKTSAQFSPQYGEATRAVLVSQEYDGFSSSSHSHYPPENANYPSSPPQSHSQSDNFSSTRKSLYSTEYENLRRMFQSHANSSQAIEFAGENANHAISIPTDMECADRRTFIPFSVEGENNTVDRALSADSNSNTSAIMTSAEANRLETCTELSMEPDDYMMATRTPRDSCSETDTEQPSPVKESQIAVNESPVETENRIAVFQRFDDTSQSYQDTDSESPEIDTMFEDDSSYDDYASTPESVEATQGTSYRGIPVDCTPRENSRPVVLMNPNDPRIRALIWRAAIAIAASHDEGNYVQSRAMDAAQVMIWRLERETKRRPMNFVYMSLGDRPPPSPSAPTPSPIPTPLRPPAPPTTRPTIFSPIRNIDVAISVHLIPAASMQTGLVGFTPLPSAHAHWNLQPYYNPLNERLSCRASYSNRQSQEVSQNSIFRPWESNTARRVALMNTENRPRQLPQLNAPAVRQVEFNNGRESQGNPPSNIGRQHASVSRGQGVQHDNGGEQSTESDDDVPGSVGPVAAALYAQYFRNAPDHPVFRRMCRRNRMVRFEAEQLLVTAERRNDEVRPSTSRQAIQSDVATSTSSGSDSAQSLTEEEVKRDKENVIEGLRQTPVTIPPDPIVIGPFFDLNQADENAERTDAGRPSETNHTELLKRVMQAAQDDMNDGPDSFSNVEMLVREFAIVEEWDPLPVEPDELRRNPLLPEEIYKMKEGTVEVNGFHRI